METKTYLKSEIDIFDYIISLTDKNPSVGVCSTRCEWENLYGRSLGSPIKPHKSVNIAYVHLLHLCRPHNDDAYSWWVWQSVAGVSSSTPPARLRPKLGAFLVVELSVVHAGRECTKHAWLATSQGIEQANRDDPHCSAAGISSPDEVLRCHPAALRGTIRLPPPYRSCSTVAQFAVKSIPHVWADTLIPVLERRSRSCSALTGTRVSVQTVRNRLHSAGFRARRPYVGVPLSQRHRQARLAWTRQNCRWTNQQWATVLFTDESRFPLDMLDRRRRVWRRRGERYANCAIVEHDRYGGGSLMVWGGISVRSRTELLVLNGTLTGQRYFNEVLQPVELPFVQQHHVVLQDDNAIPHRARIVQQFLQQNNVDHLDWPARSPDVANRACLGHSRPACTTESSTTKNAPSFGRSLAGGVEEDTPATDCQTHQE